MSIKVEFQPSGRTVTVEKGKTALEAAQIAGAGLLATCGGQASCGSCVIQLQKRAITSEPTDVEKEHLTESELLSGYRLACHTRLQKPSVITIPPRSLSALQRLQVEGDESSIPFDPRARVIDNSIEHQTRVEYRNSGTGVCLPFETPVLGMAVDLGTTKIAAYLIDLRKGITLARQGMMNPQVSYGDDVMARITYVLENQSGAETLQKAILDCLRQLAGDLCNIANSASEHTGSNSDFSPECITEVVLVGNTAMHHICLGLPLEQLGLSPYQPAVSDELDLSANQLGLNFAPQARTYLLPNVAGFVGADHVAMLLAAGILQETKNTLYLDIGTNTEVTLFIGGRMLCCSTASGPAFEGAHIRHGMRAADGAIEKIQIKNSSIYYSTIGDQHPVGICGSGIIDAIAQMRNAGILNEKGRFASTHPLVRPGEKGPELLVASRDEAGHDSDITIDRKDISEIQLTKGAIRAGVEILLSETGHSAEAIEKVVIAGAFGSFIDIKSAKIIGLFPDIPTERFQQIGNAAGIGAKQSLLSLEKRAEANQIAKQLEYIELASRADFTSAFSLAMMF